MRKSVFMLFSRGFGSDDKAVFREGVRRLGSTLSVISSEF